MDVNKNSYTFLFAIVMVIIVAAILSTAAMQLKPYQDKNIELEKQQNILSSVGVNILRDSANIIYPMYIKEELVLDYEGNILEGSAFDIDLGVELKKDPSDQLLPLFISEVDNEVKYIIPLRGKGLWGPIWGFIALEKDLNTVFGAVFDHKAETPGLGAEIREEFFQVPFVGKNIFDEDGVFKSIIVKKGGASSDDLYAVDAISGGTITSDGVTDMLAERLKMYLPYFERIKSDRKLNDSISVSDSLIINDTIIYYE